MTLAMGLSKQDDPLTGNDTYENLGYLGAGAFGAVYKARRRHPNGHGERTEVAIKMLGTGRFAVTHTRQLHATYAGLRFFQPRQRLMALSDRVAGARSTST